ncbi:hypothetical protein F2Q69_00011244 [Brassica cretica]|uniref:Uncharacterized protein n=1 Tax=Brassica cretica TaxID=69181 RepID=A0A8S9QQY5_BRACR|nr:hypothetical protein F2Q69_00011244 [Brassica cretica]
MTRVKIVKTSYVLLPSLTPKRGSVAPTIRLCDPDSVCIAAVSAISSQCTDHSGVYPTQHTLIGWFPPHIHHQIAFCSLQSNSPKEKKRYSHKQALDIDEANTHQRFVYVIPTLISAQSALRLCQRSLLNAQIIVALCLAAAIDAVEDPYPTQHTLIGWFPSHIHHQIAFCSLQSNSLKEKKRYSHKQVLDIDEANTVSITINHLPPRISLGLY